MFDVAADATTASWAATRRRSRRSSPTSPAWRRAAGARRRLRARRAHGRAGRAARRRRRRRGRSVGAVRGRGARRAIPASTSARRPPRSCRSTTTRSTPRSRSSSCTSWPTRSPGSREMARVTRPGGSSPRASGTTAAAAARSARSGTRRTSSTRRPTTSRPGRRGEGHLAELFARGGRERLEDSALTVAVEHATFDAWWELFTLGVGPAGAYVARLDEAHRAQLRELCREEFLPTASCMLGLDRARPRLAAPAAAASPAAAPARASSPGRGRPAGCSPHAEPLQPGPHGSVQEALHVVAVLLVLGAALLHLRQARHLRRRDVPPHARRRAGSGAARSRTTITHGPLGSSRASASAARPRPRSTRRHARAPRPSALRARSSSTYVAVEPALPSRRGGGTRCRSARPTRPICRRRMLWKPWFSEITTVIFSPCWSAVTSSLGLHQVRAVADVARSPRPRAARAARRARPAARSPCTRSRTRGGTRGRRSRPTA